MKQVLLILALIILSSFTQSKNFCYVIVSQEFKDKWEYYQKGVVMLKTATDTSGNIVVSCALLNEFSEIFDTMQNLEFIWLAPEAFPVDSTDWD